MLNKISRDFKSTTSLEGRVSLEKGIFSLKVKNNYYCSGVILLSFMFTYCHHQRKKI